MCLSSGHKVSQCTSSRRCRICGRRHHQAVCDVQDSRPPQPQPMLPPTTASSDEPIQTVQNVATTTSNVATSKVDILLQTAKAWARGDDGQTILVRVMLKSKILYYKHLEDTARAEDSMSRNNTPQYFWL